MAATLLQIEDRKPSPRLLRLFSIRDVINEITRCQQQATDKYKSEAYYEAITILLDHWKP